jgi:hypothetical protein
MPRGQEKQSRIVSGMLGSGPPPAGFPPGVPAGLAVPTEAETRSAVEREVTAFAQAWFAGDAHAMTRCLHPDFVNRLLGVEAGVRRGDAPGLQGFDGLDDLKLLDDLVQGVVGLQGRLGPKTAPERRSLGVRVLDVRARSASAVAELAGWVLHVHLARGAGRWSIVNAMWEMPA